MSAFRSVAAVSLFLGGLVAGGSGLIGLVYGPRRGGRAALSAGIALLAQQTLVSVAVAHGRRDRPLDAVDALTLSRGAVAALLLGIVVSGVRDRSGPAGWLAWSALLPAVTLTDWIDGPLARRRGATGLGRRLDLELDSWLSVMASLTSVTVGDLPWIHASTALSRYAGPVVIRGVGEADVYAIGRSPLGRTVGLMHMAFIVVALAPFAGARTLRTARTLAPFAAAIELVALASAALRRR